MSGISASMSVTFWMYFRGLSAYFILPGRFFGVYRGMISSVEEELGGQGDGE